jgi:hypothetical protein
LLLQDVARLATEGGELSARTIGCWAILLFCASGSFANGLCIAALFLPVATFMLEGDAAWRRIVIQLVASSLAVAAVYVIAQWLHALTGRAVLYPLQENYDAESLSWSNAEPLARTLVAAIGSGVGNLFAPALFHCEDGRLVIGPLRELSRERVEGILAAALIAWVIACTLWLRRRPRMEVRRTVALGVLVLACYGMVAARTVASKENTTMLGALRSGGIDEGALWTFSLALVTAPRYQYVPSLLLMLGTVAALPRLRFRSRSVRWAAGMGAALWVVSSAWADAAAVRAHGEGWHRESLVEKPLRGAVDAFPPGSTVYVDNGPAPIPFAPVNEVLPGRAAIALALFPQLSIDGRRIYFVEHDRQLLEQLRAGRQTPMAQLMVGVDEVPKDAQYVRRPPPPPGKLDRGDGTRG